MVYDEIGYWSEIKLEIIQKYASAYSKIMASTKPKPLYHVYIDAFAGSGIHLSKTSGDFVQGSPLNALYVEPPFLEYHFIDLNKNKVKVLQSITEKHKNVYIYEGDCNTILLEKIFPQARYEDYRRALCLLDPYGLHLNWDVIYKAGHMRSVDIFLNFPVADMNRNVLWRFPEAVNSSQIARMNAFWGDESWKTIAYQPQDTLLGPIDEKVGNDEIAAGFRTRLIEAAGFQNVPQPMPMRNTKGAIIYYLFFASQKPVASKIIQDIFRKYKNY